MASVSNLTQVNSTVLDLEILRGEAETDNSKFGFDWNCTEFTSQRMRLKIKFDTAIEIS